MSAGVGRAVDRWQLAAGMAATVLVAFTPHAIVSSTAIIPYPGSYARIGAAALAECVPIALGSIWFAAALRRRFPDRSLAVRMLIAGPLLLMVKETLLRRPVMSGFTTTAWSYNFVDNLRFAIPVLFCAITAALAAGRSRVVGAAAAIAIGAAVAFGVQPWADDAVPRLSAALALSPHDPLYPYPYGWQVQVPSYLTFVEPVVAAVAMTAVMVPCSGPARLAPYWAAVAAIVLIRGKLVLLVTNMAYQPEGPMMGFLAEAQFFVEGVLLAVGAALTWRWAVRSSA